MKHEVLVNITKDAMLLKEQTRKYLNSLVANSERIFVFTENEEERKRLLNKYNLFSLELVKRVEAFEENIAVISNMVCESDKAQDNASTLFWSSVLDSYFALCNAISRFTADNEENFAVKGAPFSVRAVSEQAIYLENAIDNFIKKTGE